MHREPACITAMESVQQAQEKAHQTIQEYQATAKENIEKARNWVSSCVQRGTEGIRVYVHRYPPLAAFLFILLVLSSIPITLFTIFVISTVVCTLSVALIGFGVVEGTILLAGTGVLLFVLAGIMVATVLGFIWGYGAYLAYAGCCKAFGSVKKGAMVVSGKLSETAQNIGSEFTQPQSSQPSYQQMPSQQPPTTTSAGMPTGKFPGTREQRA